MSHPDATELLMTARHVLMNRVFPMLPEELHYEARMIASAMGIAAREAREGARVASNEQALLSGIEGDHYPAPSLRCLRASVARAIREGRFDSPGAHQDRVKTVLLETTLNALSISNPKVTDQRRNTQ